MTTDTTEATPRHRRKARVGKVLSDRMDKTVVVSIERLVKHPTVGRYVRRREKFKVHDEKNECRVGDVIRFMETRPLSKDKRWRFVDFVERAK
ncbi:MAG: 30S ribosomal protein S17 [Candidatus Eisenbacteria bacterium]|uniref:Small ribosomal subunit protein uS17 n=1 Tax=Eiseniibacteriota bacterium TaxID=2212470 RepID=A0A849SDN3_UNCEI|nr:30S ribosomal protein S17 [Candidatus Eisenbacteria bacterium]